MANSPLKKLNSAEFHRETPGSKGVSRRSTGVYQRAAKRPKKKSNRRGRFIVLDGPDGAGKSTQALRLAERLKARGIDVLALREPGGSAVGEAIRSLVLEHRKEKMFALTETFLFQAARAQLIQEIIQPALDAGKWVICDRFHLSTLVYQGFAGGVDPKSVRTLSTLACDGVKPDLYLVVWVAPKIGIARRADRPADRMEAKGEKFIRDVANAYRREAKRDKQYTFVDGVGGLEDVEARIWKHVEPEL